MTANWNLIASHGTVLFYVVSHSDATIREIASAADLTERRVTQILHDLADSDILSVERRGRRNHYQINMRAQFPNPLGEVHMGTVVRMLREAEEIRTSF